MLQWAGERPLLIFGVVAVAFACAICAAHFLVLGDQVFLDEGVYLQYARNLTQGYYSPPGRVHLWMGPGWPLLLAPTLATGDPLLAGRLLNALFIPGAGLVMFHILRRWADVPVALGAALAFTFYPPILRNAAYASSEGPTLLFVSLVVLAVVSLREGDRVLGPGTAIMGALLAALALTKVFFGYVLLTCIVLYLVVAALRRDAASLRLLAGTALGLLLCTPYLFYTYGLTGKVFYWGTSGGMSLYWMSSPRPGDLGDWQGTLSVDQKDEFAAHRPFFERIKALDEVEADALYKRRALENIREHPASYLRNWVLNLGRMVFNYPYSYKPLTLRPLVYVIPNSLVLGFLAYVMLFLRPPPRSFAPGMVYLCVFMAGGLFGLSLLSMCSRMFTMFVPILFALAVYSYTLARPHSARRGGAGGGKRGGR